MSKESSVRFYEVAYSIAKETGGLDSFVNTDEKAELRNELEKMPEWAREVTEHDILTFFSFLPFYLHKKSYDEVSFQEFKEGLEKFLREKQHHDFFFELGEVRDYPKGYQIGTGKLITFDSLPNDIKVNVSSNRKLPFQNRGIQVNEEEFQKSLKRLWYMHMQVKASGDFYATQKAFAKFKRNIGILKLLNYEQTANMLDYGFVSLFLTIPVSVSYYSKFERGGGVGTAGRLPDTFPNRNPQWDDVLMLINSICMKENPTKLEERILNAIDIFGMIDNGIPLHLRFLLCVICLEGLLLSDEEKDYLGWKLAEKVSFLLGDSRKWFTTFLKMRGEKAVEITDELIRERLAESRAALDRITRKLYGKRSGFAHRGIIEENGEKTIRTDDYRLVSSILFQIIFKLLDLGGKGIDHIEANEKQGKYLEDDGSLNVYINKIKYSSNPPHKKHD